MKQKTIQDYYEQMYELYPTVPKSDIKRILQYGWKAFYLHNSYGGDVCITRKGFWLYCGRLMKDSLKHFEYYKKKLCLKIKIFQKRFKIPYDGYYYIALTKNRYNQYINKKNKRGRPRKRFTFEKVVLYKSYDICNIENSSSVAILKVSYPIDMGETFYLPKFETDKTELVLVREPLKFQDILTTKYEFELDYLNITKRYWYDRNKKDGD